MKLNCGLTQTEREQKQREENEASMKRDVDFYRRWRKKFLWLPKRMWYDTKENSWHHRLGVARVWEETRDCRWLETVEVSNPITYIYYSSYFGGNRLNVGDPIYRPIDSSEIQQPT